MLEMLLKQAGINPDEIKNFAGDLAKFVKVVDTRLTHLTEEMAHLRAENAEMRRLMEMSFTGTQTKEEKENV